MRHLIVVLTLALLAVGLLTAPATAVGTISDTINIRLPEGNNAPAPLALRFSQATFPEGTRVDEVLLATEESFADALASGTLQGTDTPLLLTSSDVLRADVASEIDRLGADRVIMLGGEAALDASVEDALTDVGLDVTRLAGDTRFETAAAIAEQADDPDTAIVARGFAAGGDDTQAFADALAAGAFAAENGWPIYLTQSEELTPSTRDAIVDSGVENVLLLGGEAAIAPQVETDIEALGIDVDRIFGQTRFHTAVAIARARGFASAAEADRIILVEGQADDAWAAGFAAAAHGALASAPVLLANDETLPPATVEFLLSTASGSDFAVDAAEVTEPVLVCAARAAACDQARAVLGLPREAELTLAEPDDGVPSRSDLTGTIDLFDYPATIAVFGECVTDGLIVPDEDGAFAVSVVDQPGVCSLEFEITFANGSVQTIIRPILVAPAEPQDGVIVDTETGGDRYRFVPDGGDAVVTVPYSEDDVFIVNGQDATIGAFEASVTIADRVLFSADTTDGTIHELTDVDPQTLTTGTVGNVNLQEGTLAIIEPVSGVVLRGGLDLPDDVDADYAIGDVATDRAGFEANVNEGDDISFGTAVVRLTNLGVGGPATDLAIDAVSGVARFRIGALGDDPLNAEDERFRAVADDPAKEYRVDHRVASFSEFAAALTVGDGMSYRRAGGVETFQLVNAAPPPVQGLVTETFNPDGSPVAPEPSDGGELTVLTPAGRQEIAYSADAVVLIDDRVATEAELETARTPGDQITYQVGDPSTDTAEQVSLVNRDLSGDLSDITEGANTFDVLVLSGVVYDDLDYTRGVLGGDSVYVINGDTVGLAQFENELALVDRGEVQAAIVVRATSEGTEHRLTSEELSG